MVFQYSIVSTSIKQTSQELSTYIMVIVYTHLLVYQDLVNLSILFNGPIKTTNPRKVIEAVVVEVERKNNRNEKQ